MAHTSFAPVIKRGASMEEPQMKTLRAPPVLRSEALETEVKNPDASITYSAPALPHAVSFGSALQRAHRARREVSM